MIAEQSFHPETRSLLAYARALAGVGRAPSMAAADRLVERLFVVQDIAGALRLRSSGVEMEGLFGAPLGGLDLLAFLPPPQRPLLMAFVGAITSADLPGVLQATAETRIGRRLGVEMLLTPLRAVDCEGRYLGLFQPLGGEIFVRGSPITTLSIGALYTPDAKRSPSLRLVVSN